MRITWSEISRALRKSNLRWVLPANFVLIPLLTAGLSLGLRLPGEIAVGMLLLASAPFAPVVPTFTKMARGDLALAAGLTAVFPFLCAFLSPLVCRAAFAISGNAGTVDFNFLQILLILTGTITFPLALGLGIRRWAPRMRELFARPIAIVSEAIGAASLIFVTIAEFPGILKTGWTSLLAMGVGFELAFFVGYFLSGPASSVRKVIALGTSNRNIALAVLIAVDSFPRTGVAAAVVTNGLMLIFLGLAHVAWFRFVYRSNP